MVYIPLVVYWMCLLLATSIPAVSMPKVAISDKIKHFSAFFGLSVLLSLTLLYQEKNFTLKKHFLTFTLLIVSGYGFLDELHQTFIPGRNGEFLDWVADSIGAIVGVLLMGYLIKKFNYVNEILLNSGRNDN